MPNPPREEVRMSDPIVALRLALDERFEPDPLREELSLRAILSSERKGKSALPRMAMASVTILTLALICLTALSPGAPVARAATPPVIHSLLTKGRALSTSSDLARVAQAARLSDDAGHLGSRYDAWYLNTRVEGEVSVSLEPEMNEVSFDDTGRAIATTKRAALEERRLFQPGEYALVFPEGLSLPSDPAALAAILERAHPRATDSAAELLVAVADLYREQTPTPAVRAGVLTLLARHPELISLGRVEDRRGRMGLGYAVDSADANTLPTRVAVVIDEKTGALLSFEKMLTRDAGALPVEIPAVLAYETFYPAMA